MRGNDLNKQIYSYLKINLQQTSKEKAKEKKKGKKNDPPIKSEPTSHPRSHYTLKDKPNSY